MEKRLDFGEPDARLVAASEEQHEIVHVPEIVPNAEALAHEVIERVEVEVGEHLAREVADRHAGGEAPAAGIPIGGGRLRAVRDQAAEKLAVMRVIEARLDSRPQGEGWSADGTDSAG